ncbi:hypothetical protein 2 [Forsythia suspensa hepe-like virus]|nr:hypothetical protein 2 [Forsythia suspensa hepe-like virus]
MSTPTTNDIDLNLFSDLQKDSEVQSSSTVVDQQTAVIRKSLHPPSAIPGYLGLPTNDARSQVLLNYRNPSLMQTPYLLRGELDVVTALTAADLTTFNYAILSTNGARVLGIGFIYNSAVGGMSQDLNGVIYQDAYNFENWQDDANLYRPINKSLTTYLNATAFNDTGMVTCNQFNPNILFAGTLLTFAHQLTEHFYHFVKSGHKARRLKIISKPTRDEVDTFMAFPHYHRLEMLRIVGANPSDVLDLDPNTTIQVLNIGDVGVPNGTYADGVPTASQITNNSMRSYVGKAREGCFAVQRLNTISPSWLSGSNTSNGNEGLYQCYFYAKDSTGGVHFVPFNENAALGTQVPNLEILKDTLWTKDMTFSWQRYDGLSLNSQTSISTQLLLRKYHVGYEVQPTPRSAWAGMVNLGPKPDLMTMQAMMDAFYELKDGMPARYNFWGTLASIAGQGLATFGSSLLQKLFQPSDTPKQVNETNASQVKPAQSRRRAKKNAPKMASRTLDMDRKINALMKKVDNMYVRRPVRPRSRTRSQSRTRSAASRAPPTPKPRLRSLLPKQQRARFQV